MARIKNLVRKPTLEKHIVGGAVESIDVYEQDNGGYLVRVQFAAIAQGERHRWLTAARQSNTVREFRSLDGLWSFMKATGVKTILVHAYASDPNNKPEDGGDDETEDVGATVE